MIFRTDDNRFVEAPTWFVARQVMGCDVTLDEPEKQRLMVYPTVLEAKWVGSDAGAQPNLHLEVRSRVLVVGIATGGRGPWSDWRPWP